MKIIRLKFTTPIHIANARRDYGFSETVIHSDTIYSAILNAWNVLGLTEFIPKDIQDNLPFTISSLFPYTIIGSGKSEIVYFLPRPASFNPSVPIQLNKKVKKIAYLEADLFRAFQEGNTLDIEENLIKDEFLTEKSIEKPLFTRSEIPRVRVPRSEGDSEPFYIERIYFNENSGLYFFIDCEKDEVFNAVKIALNFLKDEGIGTDKNVGNGKFTWELEPNADIISFTNNSNGYSMNLSLYIPESHEQIKSAFDDKCYFSFVTRGGWITSYPYLSLRKKYIRMIKEGSILKIPSGISGRGVDITPNKDILPETNKNIHPIFRFGKSFWVPIKP